MAYIDWNDILSVGFDEVDADHKKLIGMVNQIHETITQSRDQDQLADALEELISYTSWHFRHEERLMQNSGYPDMYSHQGEHRDLANRATELYEKFLDGDESVPDRLLPFLKDWLTQHITGTVGTWAAFWQHRGSSSGHPHYRFERGLIGLHSSFAWW